MLEGIVRESIDKRSTKALRKDGYLIANIYAKGVENINAAFKVNDFIKAVKVKSDLKFQVSVGGKTYDVVVVDYQKHPVTSALKHVDLKVVLDDEVSKYMIPVKPFGTPIGFKNKGVLLQSKKRLAVKCKGKDLINSFDVDVSGLDVDDTILVRDIKTVPGVRILDADRVAVLGVIKAK
ncbi:50S ribosomal protein L25/general stress protein Ctc [Campylobacter fetus]|uniref:50S ribosomal protein L25 n=3 Tax=Campylobacter fetus TaxID=196 RepID=A0A5L4IDD6_CAMFE|nr:MULTISPECIES: 50S ribosomal protein L25/general stress protein Ctc [Campylobacter]OCS23035.1 50S ribosomal protein L25/general stress protein Ctc [Campylobacter fetus subsp. venerealis cfvi97/532]OCS27230.1 50S ribosomal protein L25/general stress protein Ctc [Campylobacter fetus subsp. venerealis cfvB10]OCS30335.1 50S ribosomal protein L25/general stress protein Ctc [Campylobacter fetus subsp. venerealis LMG 6570 = CCUG 33900]OCS41423.1 50S ribosomal protein L25/general stress protein Ctc [